MPRLCPAWTAVADFSFDIIALLMNILRFNNLKRIMLLSYTLSVCMSIVIYKII